MTLRSKKAIFQQQVVVIHVTTFITISTVPTLHLIIPTVHCLRLE